MDNFEANHTIILPRPGGSKRPCDSVQPKIPDPVPLQSKKITTDLAETTGVTEVTLATDFGTNPFVSSAIQLFMIASKVPTIIELDHVETFHQKCQGLIDDFETKLRALKSSENEIKITSYILCSLIDELVLNTPWGIYSSWASNSLLSQKHFDTFGGERVFSILDNLLNSRKEQENLLEFFFLCLSLGFKGKYRLDANGQSKLETLRSEIYKRLKTMRKRDIALTDISHGSLKARNETILPWILSLISIAVVALLTGTFIGLRHKLDLKSRDAFAALSTPISTNSTVVHSSFARYMDLLTLGLSVELREKQIELTEGKSTLTLRTTTEIFRSGRVEIAPKYELLLKRVALVLSRIPGKAKIVGHSDDQKIESNLYPSNRELSLARAEVVRSTLEKYAPLKGRLESEGRGETEPLVPNTSLANKTRNRRIEIILYAAPNSLEVLR